MNAPTKLGGFGAALAVALLVSYGIGNAVGPVGGTAESHGTEGHAVNDETTTTTTMAGHDMAAMDAAAKAPAGLTVSESGYTLALESPILPAGTTTIAFQILGPDASPVTNFEVAHDKELHLIAVRRDTTGFQHVHPTMDDRGTWRVDVSLTPGAWRFFADFQALGQADGLTLGVDASVAGAYDPAPLPAETRSATVDGYTVTLSGTLSPGASSEVDLNVTRDGQPVTDLETYLGAYGHLVALRTGDLAYLHVHPEGEPGDGRTEPGPDIAFFATVPSAGWYLLYLDFKHEGVVRTAEFTLPAGPNGAGSDTTTAVPVTTDSGDDGHGGH